MHGQNGLGRARRWLIAVVASLGIAATAAAEERLTPAQLRADYDVLVDTLRHRHPDTAHSVAPLALDAALATLAQHIEVPLTRNEAWQHFAQINPVVADAHFVVTWPDHAALTKAHLSAGGALFPFEVRVDDAGGLTVVAQQGGAATPFARSRIAKINGVDARRVVQRLSQLVHGDTPAFRARLLSDRWYFYYWKVFGAPQRFDITLVRDGARSVSLPASRTLPRLVARRDDFDATFHFALLPGNAAVLTVNSFSWPGRERWFAFADAAFAQMREAGTRTLVVDVRDNGGGDDELWMRGILRHIADKPYRWASTYRKRVMEANPAKGEAVGDVVDGEVARLVEPERDDPLRFDGKLVVLIGDATYSSSVLFANVVKDYGFGTVAGARGGVVRARQSGGTRETALPNTGLVVGWPRFVLDPPRGKGGEAWLVPDRVVCDDPFDRMVAVRATLGDASACR
jgi:hypothetical protein